MQIYMVFASLVQPPLPLPLALASKRLPLPPRLLDDDSVGKQSLGSADSAAAPIGVHLGVVCDKTLSPIVGYRFTRRGSRPSYDLCQTEFDKLVPEVQALFERIEPPVTPRRALLGMGALAVVAGLR